MEKREKKGPEREGNKKREIEYLDWEILRECGLLDGWEHRVTTWMEI